MSIGKRLRLPLPVALHQATAYITTGTRMEAVNTATGATVATFRPRAQPVATDDALNAAQLSAAPLLVDDSGRSLVLATFMVDRKGGGTQSSHTMVETVAVDASTRKVSWRLSLAVPEWAEGGVDETATAVGAAQGIAVISLTAKDGGHTATYGIDLDRHRQSWSIDRFKAGAVVGQSVVGSLFEDSAGVGQKPAGFKLTSGKNAWQGARSTEVRVTPAGPRFVRVRGADYGSGDGYDRLTNPASGRTFKTMPQDLTDFESDCTYDEQSMLICSGSNTLSTVAYGLDATTGSVRWQLPDKNVDRIAPNITTAWHGRVYATTGNGTIMLDARTGKDLTDPGVAPIFISESAGLALSDEDHLIAYPTSG
ncbi:hypothetical protein [Streptomyces sp. NPDC048508]|uniref:hypothetical protein n=1 Tax=Streptomyces sp. NPDC048508 TaxID=3365561 RepID=UPI003711B3B1